MKPVLNGLAGIALFIAGALAIAQDGSTTGGFSGRTPPPPASSGANLDDLERAFWNCDYVATRFGPQNLDTLVCSVAYEELMQRRFEGRFDRLLEWWRNNKQAQHEAARARLPPR